MTSRDVVIRDIKTTTVPQLRDVHIRDKIIKDCFLLGSTLTVGMYFPRTVSCLHRRVLSFSPISSRRNWDFPTPSLGRRRRVGESQLRRGDIHCGTLYMYVLCEAPLYVLRHFHKDVFKYRRCSLPVELLQLPEVG